MIWLGTGEQCLLRVSMERAQGLPYSGTLESVNDDSETTCTHSANVTAIHAVWYCIYMYIHVYTTLGG